MTAPVTTALTRPEDLLAEGLVTPADMPALAQVAQDFRIRVTPAPFPSCQDRPRVTWGDPVADWPLLMTMAPVGGAVSRRM